MIIDENLLNKCIACNQFETVNTASTAMRIYAKTHDLMDDVVDMMQRILALSS